MKKKIKSWWSIAFLLLIFGFFANGTLSIMFFCVGGWTLGWNIVKPYIEGKENG
jgi:hypothetical protein